MNSARIRRLIAAGMIGNVLEWYDFAIYGYFATQIGHMLIKWGFLDAPTPENTKRIVKTLSRYVAAITKAEVEDARGTP